jgi:hypothetical protein
LLQVLAALGSLMLTLAARAAAAAASASASASSAAPFLLDCHLQTQDVVMEP